MAPQTSPHWLVDEALSLVRAALLGYAPDEAHRQAIEACGWLLAQLGTLRPGEVIDVTPPPPQGMPPRASISELAASCVAKLLPHLRPDVREQLEPLASPAIAEQWLRHVVGQLAKRIIERAT